MPPTVVHAALAGLLGAAVLGRALDWRAAAVVVAAGAAPDLDLFAALVREGLHGAVLHTVLIPLAAGALLYYDDRVREASVVRTRYGAHGVAVAWTAVFAYAVAGIGLDAFNVDGAAVLWPLQRRFYVVVGRAVYSTQDGFVQTFVQVQSAWPPVVFRTYPVSGFFTPTPLNPTRGPDPANAERVLYVVESGWQFLLLVTGAVVTAVTARAPTVAGTGPDEADRRGVASPDEEPVPGGDR